MSIPRNGLPPSFRYALMRAEAKLSKEPELPDIATVDEGTPIGLVYGKTRVRSPALVWWGDFSERENTVASGPNGDTTFQEKRVGMQFGLGIGCENTDLTKIWVGDHPAWSGSALSHGIESDGGYDVVFGTAGAAGVDATDILPGGGAYTTGYFTGTVRWYPGNFTQTENAYLTAEIGGVNTAHRGTSYAVLHNTTSGFEIGRDERPPPIHFELSNYPDAVGGADSRNIDDDANPAEVIYDILTGGYGRLGLPTSFINTASFLAAVDALKLELYGGVSFAALASTPAIDIINDILRHIDAVLYVEPLTNQLHLKLIREDYDVGDLDTYTEADLVEGGVLMLEQDLGEETIDEVKVTYEDRIANYQTRSGTAQNMAVYHGLTTPRSRTLEIRFPMIRRIQAAQRIATRELLVLSTPLMTARLAFKRTAFNLRPGDVFLWTHAEFQIVARAMRVISVDWGTKDDGRIVVDCARDVFAMDKVLFDPPDFAEPPTFEDPVAATVRKTIEMPQWFGYLAEEEGRIPDRDNIRLFYLVEAPSATIDGFRAYTSTNGGTTYFTSEVSRKRIAHTAKVETAYPHYAEPYDPGPGSGGLGLELYDLSDSGTISLLASASEAQVRAGANIILVGDEFMSFESVTDLGSGSYRLDNVWRGILDTVPVDHAVDEPIWFIIDANIFLFNLGSYGFSDAASLLIKMSTHDAVTGLDLDISGVASDALTIVSRSVSPFPPGAVKYFLRNSNTTPGDAFTAISTAATNDYPGEPVAGEAENWITTSELYTTYRRRIHDTEAIRRGDDADEAGVPFGTEYQIAADAGSGYATLVSGITGANSLIPLAGAGAGAGNLRTRCTRNTPSPTRTSFQSREIPTQFAFFRQLLINPHFDDATPSRGWTVVSGTPLYNSDASTFGASGNHLRGTDNSGGEVSQVVNIEPLGVDGGGVALLTFWMREDDVGTFSRCSVAAEDDGAVELASSPDVGVDSGDWTPAYALVSLPATTAQLRVIAEAARASIVGDGEDTYDGLIDALDLRAVPSLSDELLTNGHFDTDLTGWTVSNMIWDADGTIPGTEGICRGDGDFATCQAYQEVPVPPLAAIGDIVHLRVMRCFDVVGDDTGTVTLQQRNGAGGSVELSATTGAESIATLLHVRDLYLKLSAVTGRYLRVVFDGARSAGATIITAFDAATMRIYSPTLGSFIPDTPANFVATPGDEEVTLTWDTSVGAARYTLYFDETTGVTKETGSAIANVTSPYVHTGLDNETEYFYVVTASADAGESDDSTEDSATPTAGSSRLTIGVTHKETASSTDNGTGWTTGSISWDADDLLVAWVLHCESATTPTAPTGLTTTGLTWAQAGTAKRVDNRRMISCWTARPSGSSSGTVAIAVTESSVSAAWSISAYTNTADTGYIVQTKTEGIETNANPVTSIAVTLDGALEDATNVMAVCVGIDIESTVAPDASFAELGDDSEANNAITIESQWAANETSNTSTFSSADAAIFAIEIKSGTS